MGQMTLLCGPDLAHRVPPGPGIWWQGSNGSANWCFPAVRFPDLWDRCRVDNVICPRMWGYCKTRSRHVRLGQHPAVSRHTGWEGWEPLFLRLVMGRERECETEERMEQRMR